jgi:hypothetical protein
MKHFLKKYRFILIAVAVFLVLGMVADGNSFIGDWRLQMKIRALEEQREFYLERIREDSTVLENLRDPRFLEEYAREHFYMRREEEELYLVRP